MNKTRYLKGECSHCRGHIEFPVEATGLTADCPHCGQLTELMLTPPPQESSIPRKAIVWTVIAVIILSLGLAGALAALKRAEKWAAREKQKSAVALPATNTGPPQTEDPLAQAGFSSGTVTLEKTPGTSLVHAVGTLNNLADRQRFGVKVELALFDASGRKLGTATDYQQILEPKAHWRFRAPVVDSKTVTAKVALVKEDQ